MAIEFFTSLFSPTPFSITHAKTPRPPTKNQKWQKLMDKVEASYARQKFTLPENYSYNFEAQLDQIEKAQAAGKKICLFVGRTPLEKLPSDNGEAKENEFWVSADLFIYPQCKDPEIEKSEIKNRCFLWLELNDDQFIELISGLFDKVVIDLSTSKGLTKFFTTRFKALLRDENSELISERFGYGMFSIDARQPQLSDNKYDIPYNDYEKFQDFLIAQGVDEDKITEEAQSWMDEQALTAITERFNENYSSVELKKSAQFPYFSTMNPENAPMDYFVLKGKKT